MHHPATAQRRTSGFHPTMRAESLIRNSLDQAVDTEGTRGCSPKDHKNRCSDDHRSWVLHRWGGSQLPATNPFFASINLASLGFTTFAGLDDDVAIQFGSILKHPIHTAATELRNTWKFLAFRITPWPSSRYSWISPTLAKHDRSCLKTEH